ncbi:OmpH family outer membrane protein [Proteiniphilum acetatigenes]|uniref:OmpH family outer membrane protein n=1 Tax=Proteiniphilum acetatigenes TaxID=294710 RepID=UPI00037044D9|nr:OmpH family outer membrane protein [Proteiniphilum acetatigenes]SFK85690.1 periplasmic chaperone for outer membrane proteins Skp [Porphyromonadaceae bacterium KH3CP3RA]
MLKKLLILCIALAPLAAMAQEVKIATVNVQEIFAAMPELSGIETQLSTKQDEIRKNIQALQDEYSKKLEEFEKSPAVSDAGKQDQQKQIIQLEERYQTYMQNGQQELSQLQQKLLEPINRKIFDAIKAVGDENNYAFVYDISSMQSPIVYFTPSAVDITPQVKTKLGL